MDEEFATDSVDQNAWIGRILGGKYRLEKCIGQSGDTLVFRAWQLNLRRDVAVKVLFADTKGLMQLGDRMRREARLIAAIRHPGLAQMYDEGVASDGRPYLVMELLRGQSLEDRLFAEKRIAPAEAVRITLDAAAILEVVHTAGYVHRDIKPGNIFLEDKESEPANVKLIDFGMARQVRAGYAEDAVAQKTLAGLGGGTQIKTLPGSVFGTPHYMSPEQCRGADVGARSDLYSLGVVLFEMLAGTPPFDGELPVRIMARHVAVEPPLLREVAPDLAHLVPLEHFLERALEKDRQARYQTAREFADALREAYDRPPARRRPRAQTFALSTRWVAVATGLALTVAAGAAAMIAAHLDPEVAPSASESPAVAPASSLQARVQPRQVPSGAPRASRPVSAETRPRERTDDASSVSLRPRSDSTPAPSTQAQPARPRAEPAMDDRYRLEELKIPETLLEKRQ